MTGQELGEDGIGPARVFDTSDWKIVTVVDHVGTTNELDFTYDDAYMVTVGSRTARVWRVADWSLHFEDTLEGKLVDAMLAVA